MDFKVEGPRNARKWYHGWLTRKIFEFQTLQNSSNSNILTLVTVFSALKVFVLFLCLPFFFLLCKKLGWKAWLPQSHSIAGPLVILKIKFNHSHKKRKDSLETRAEPAILCVYVEYQAILEPILLYRASKCKQTKEQGSEDCLWTHIFIFLRNYNPFFFFFSPKCKYNRIKLCYNRLLFVKETQISTVSNIEQRAKLHRS